MGNYYTSLPFIVSNGLAVFIVICAMIWPTVARTLLSIVFILAFATNLFLALTDPLSYLYFGEVTVSEFYRRIILGPFSKHVPGYIITIAICQLFIGIFIAYKGQIMKVAMLGGIVFLVAIIPFGSGSAFPAPLMLVLAFVILLSKRITFNIYEIIYRKTFLTTK